MGCGGSSIRENEENQHLKNNRSTNLNQNGVSKNPTIKELEVMKENKSGINKKEVKVVNRGNPEELEFKYYSLEIVSNTEIQFKEKENIKDKRDNRKNTLIKYLKSENQKSMIFRNLQRDKLEYLIYCFHYNNGNVHICNFYEADEIDVKAESGNNEDMKEENGDNNNEEKNININGNDYINGKEINNDDDKNYNKGNGIEDNNNDEKEKLIKVDNNKDLKKIRNDNKNSNNAITKCQEFVYSIWMIDIEAIDLDPNEIINLIEGREEIKDLKFKCSNLGEVFIETEPDMSDNGIVEYKPPENAKEITITKELDEDLVKSTKQNLENEHINGYYLKRNKFNQPIFLFDSLNLLISLHPERIVSFTLSDNLNLGDAWIKVNEAISRFENLINLNLSMGFIYDKYLVSLFNALKHKRIVSLDLSSNFITYVGARTIGKWLKGNRTIKDLNIQQNTMNEFKREGFDFIAEPLKNLPNIQLLDVSYMILTGFGSKLAELVKKASTLKILKIKNVRMNYLDYHNLIPALCDNNSIEELYLNDNNAMKEESIDLLAKMIITNKTIHTLFLDKVGLTLENCRQFFLALKKNETITTLSLNDNPEVSVKKYVDFFKDKPSIKKLYLMNRNSIVRRTKDELKMLEKFKETREKEEGYLVKL